VTHRAFTWDAPDGAEGAVIAEFGDRGYEVEIRALDAGDGLDDPLWAGALGVQLANEAAVLLTGRCARRVSGVGLRV
jgi:hypothetical protein